MNTEYLLNDGVWNGDGRVPVAFEDGVEEGNETVEYVVKGFLFLVGSVGSGAM